MQMLVPAPEPRQMHSEQVPASASVHKWLGPATRDTSSTLALHATRRESTCVPKLLRVVALSSRLLIVKVANGAPPPRRTPSKRACAEDRAGTVGKWSSGKVVSRGDIDVQSVAATHGNRANALRMTCCPARAARCACLVAAATRSRRGTLRLTYLEVGSVRVVASASLASF